jgi:hypothetical protein
MTAPPPHRSLRQAAIPRYVSSRTFPVVRHGTEEDEACMEPSAGVIPRVSSDRYQLLGDESDSKEVAIGMENFVIPDKAFSLQQLRLKCRRRGTQRKCSDCETATFENSIQ